MGASERVFVTADSVSMTHEAIASGRPVVCLEPTQSQPNVRVRKLLRIQEEAGRVVTHMLGAPDELECEAPPGGWRMIVEDPSVELGKRVWNRLQAEIPATENVLLAN